MFIGGGGIIQVLLSGGVAPVTLVAFDGTPLVVVGAPGRDLACNITALGTAATIDTLNEALIFYGQIFTDDGGSHTIDTSGSSALEWRTGTVTFANAGTTAVVGLAAVDTANGPPARAANSGGVITFDVSKTMAGNGGGVTSAAWQTHVPDAGTKTIANGDLVAFGIQFTARAGADSVIVQSEGLVNGYGIPGTTTFDGTSTYSNGNRLPNVVITFSDGHVGYFYGGFVASVGSTTQTWNNTSGTKEYGNFLQMPVPAKIYGIMAQATVGGDMDFVLYSDPLGTPFAEKTVSTDLNTVSAASSQSIARLFASPYSSTASQPLAVVMKPTSATNVSSVFKTFNSAVHQGSETLGTNGYAISRNTGAFAAQNSNKDRFAIGLLVGGFSSG